MRASHVRGNLCVPATALVVAGREAQVAFIPWLDFWREFWIKPPACKMKPSCDLDELSSALAEYLESAREVAAGAAKNVEDAERLMQALNELMEHKKRAGGP